MPPGIHDTLRISSRSLPRRGAALALALCSALASVDAAWADVTAIPPATCRAMKDGHVLADGSPVPCDRLREVSFRFIDFSGETRLGRVVVMDAVAGPVQALFDELHARHFPLRRAVPMQAYLGDDDASMDDDNTSGFNARLVAGSTRWSLHAFGLAIDLNPVENPFIEIADDGRTLRVSPAAAGRAFVNRREPRPGKPPRQGLAEEVVDVFAAHGFLVWGGDWNSPIDFQHFEAGDQDFAQRLLTATPSDAASLVNARIERYRRCRAAPDSSGSPQTLRVRCVSTAMHPGAE
jgi:hypothetical protein